jgi:hypothetical protein
MVKIADLFSLDLLQLFATFTGGGFAIYLLYKSNSEKRQALVLSVYDKLYNDTQIRDALYAADKNIGLEELERKVIQKDTSIVKMEIEVDKALRYINLIGLWMKGKKLNQKDILAFKYEISELLKNKIIYDYIIYLKTIKVDFSGIDYIYERMLNNVD